MNNNNILIHYANKFSNDYTNTNTFKLFSGIFGLITYILLALTFLLSYFTLKVKFLFKSLPKNYIMLAHVTLGIVAYAQGFADFLLGIFSGWFEKTGGTAAQVCCVLLTILLTVNILWPPISRRLIKPIKAITYSHF